MGGGRGLKNTKPYKGRYVIKALNTSDKGGGGTCTGLNNMIKSKRIRARLVRRLIWGGV